MSIIFTRKRLAKRFAYVMMKYLRLAEQYASEESIRQMAMNRYTAIKELANYLGIFDQTKIELETLTELLNAMEGEKSDG